MIEFLKLILFLFFLKFNFLNSQVINTGQEIDPYLLEIVETKYQSQSLVASYTATQLEYLMSANLLTPKILKELVITNVMQDTKIFGSAVAFEPYVFNASEKEYDLGIPKANEYSFKSCITTKGVDLSSNLHKALYAPYVYRNFENISGPLQPPIDLAGSYCYPDENTFWYDVPKEKFEKNKKKYGGWSKPYYDAGAGEADMVTFSSTIVGGPNKHSLLGVVTIDILVKDFICSKEKSDQSKKSTGGGCDKFACNAGEEFKTDTAGNFFCEICKPGSFNLFRGDGVCELCPQGGLCRGGRELRAIPGYWEPDNFDKEIHDMYLYKCHHSEYCCPKNETGASCDVDDNERCLKGHRGVLCESCSDGYAPFGPLCLLCDEGRSIFQRKSFYLIIMLPFVFSFFFCYLPSIFVTKMKYGTGSIIIDFVQILYMVSQPLENFSVTINNESEKFRLSVVNAFVQILKLSVGHVDIFVKYLNCPMNWGVSWGMYVWVLIGILCIFFLEIQVKLLRYFSKKRPSLKLVYVRICAGRWRLFSFVYLMLVKTGFESMQCRKIGLKYYNEMNPGVECYTATYNAASILGVGFSVTVGILVPLGFFAYLSWVQVEHGLGSDKVLNENLIKYVEKTNKVAFFDFAVPTNLPRPKTFYRRRKSSRNLKSKLSRKNSKMLDELKTIEKRLPEKVQTLIANHGWLFMKYKPHARLWWSSFMFLRRTAFMVAHVMYVDRNNESSDQFAIVAVSLCLISLIFQTAVMPYITATDNQYAVACMALLTFYAALNIRLKQFVSELQLSGGTATTGAKNLEINWKKLIVLYSGLFFIWAGCTFTLSMHRQAKKNSTRYHKLYKLVLEKLEKFFVGFSTDQTNKILGKFNSQKNIEKFDSQKEIELTVIDDPNKLFDDEDEDEDEEIFITEEVGPINSSNQENGVILWDEEEDAEIPRDIDRLVRKMSDVTDKEEKFLNKDENMVIEVMELKML